MEKWWNSVAVITGANTGIGLSILKTIALCGVKMVGLDLKLEEIDKLKVELKTAKIYSFRCDVTDDESTELAFKWIEQNVGNVDLLVNCAGIHKNIGILNSHMSMTEIQNHIDVNLTSAIRCTRRVIKSLQARDVFGYVVNINCVYGHYVLPTKDVQLGVFGSTKFALKATADVMRFELNRLNNRKIRITNLSPGVCTRKSSEDMPEDSPFLNPVIRPERIAETVVYLLTTPNEITITDLSIKATGSDL